MQWKKWYTLYGSIGNTHCSDYGCSLYAAAKQTACIWFHNGLAESACGVCWIFPREFLSNRTAVSRLFITAWSWSEYGRVYLLRAAATGDIAILCVSYDQDVYLHYDQQHCSHNHKHGIVLLLDKETKYFATCCIFCFGYFFMCRSHAVSYA